jgi:DDE superfamily endonuclease
LFIHLHLFPNPEVAEFELPQADNISSSSIPPLPTSSLSPLPTSLLVLDSVEFHKTEAVKTKAKELNTILSIVPPGLTHKLQPLDVSFNKPFKQRVQELQDSMSIAERPDRDILGYQIGDKEPGFSFSMLGIYHLGTIAGDTPSTPGS